MERLEEFVLEGKSFIYFDMSEVSKNHEFHKIAEDFKKEMVKYLPNSLYTITNVRGVRFDSETKAYMADYMAFNKPYVRYGAVIGFDSIKKAMGNKICKMVGRPSMYYALSKELAIEWLLKQD